MAQPVTPERFFQTATAYQNAAAMNTAVELGLFTAIAEGHNTAARLGEHLKIAPRGARILADFLAVTGFLKKSGDTYSLSEDAALFLDRNSPAYIGAAVEFLCSPHLHQQFDKLTDRVRRGGAPSVADTALVPDHDSWVRFARAMGGLMTMPAQGLAGLVLALPAFVNRPLRILDIAAGHGVYGIAFLQQSPQAQVVGQDWKPVLAVALENAAKVKVGDRYTTMPGSAFEVDFGRDAFDVVLIPNFLHHFDMPANLTLMKKIRSALKPGGIAVTLEFSPNDERTDPPNAVTFALIMLASTPSGDAFTVGEITQLYKDAGFTHIQSHMLPNAMQRMFSGTK